MANSLRALLIVLPTMAALIGTVAAAQAGQPQARQSFSVRVPGKVEVASLGRRTDGSPSTIRVTSSERVEVRVERRPATSSAAVPMLQSRLTTPDDSLTFPTADMVFDSTGNTRTTVIVTVVPLW